MNLEGLYLTNGAETFGRQRCIRLCKLSDIMSSLVKAIIGLYVAAKKKKKRAVTEDNKLSHRQFSSALLYV